MYKRCWDCKETKEVNNFWKDCTEKDGISPRCILCMNKNYRLRRKLKPEIFCNKDKRYYQKHKEEIKKRRKENRNPIKEKARSMVRYRLYKGEIKQLPCEKCGNNKAEAHHDNYLKPLEIRWLCKSCHGLWHRDNVAIS